MLSSVELIIAASKSHLLKRLYGKFFFCWLWLLKNTAWNCLHIFSIHLRVEIQTTARAKTQPADHGQWPTALRYFKWALGAEQNQSEKGKVKQRREGLTELEDEDRSKLIQGTQLWQYGNHNSSLSYQRKDTTSYYTSLIVKRRQSEKMFAEKYCDFSTSPPMVAQFKC